MSCASPRTTACAVLVDGETVLENWTWHAPTRDEADFDLAPGRHEFTLEYFQIDGAFALAIDLSLEPPG